MKLGQEIKDGEMEKYGENGGPLEIHGVILPGQIATLSRGIASTRRETFAGVPRRPGPAGHAIAPRVLRPRKLLTSGIILVAELQVDARVSPTQGEFSIDL